MLIIGGGSFSGSCHVEKLKDIARLKGFLVCYTNENWSSQVSDGGHLFESGSEAAPGFNLDLVARPRFVKSLPPPTRAKGSRTTLSKTTIAEGFYGNRLMRVEWQQESKKWIMSDITSRNGSPPTNQRWRLLGDPILNTPGKRTLVSVRVEAFLDSFFLKCCRVAGCSCSVDTSGNKRWRSRDTSGALMILVLFVFQLVTGRSLTGLYLKRSLKTAWRVKDKDVVEVPGVTVMAAAKDAAGNIIKDDQGKAVKVRTVIVGKYQSAQRRLNWYETMYGKSGRGSKTFLAAWLHLVNGLQARDLVLSKRVFQLDRTLVKPLPKPSGEAGLKNWTACFEQQARTVVPGGDGVEPEVKL
jgi:hypothetical protein